MDDTQCARYQRHDRQARSIPGPRYGAFDVYLTFPHPSKRRAKGYVMDFSTMDVSKGANDGA